MNDITLQDLLEAGSHFGHQVRRWNPAMKKYIYGQRDKVHIFDLVKTKAGLEEACTVAKQWASEGKTILYVGTKRQAADIVKREAIRAGMPFMAQRWMGGLLTNFTQINRRLIRLSDLKAKREAGELRKYTKWEQMQYDREIEKLEKFFGGVAAIKALPDALFVVDSHREEVAVREANRMNIPVIAIVDSNGDPDRVQHIIPANDDAAKSVEMLVMAVTDAIVEGKGGKVGPRVKKTGEETQAAVITAAEEDQKLEKVEEKAEENEVKQIKARKPRAKKAKED